MPESKSSIIGLVGERGTSRIAVQQELAEKNVKISRGSVSDIRSGHDSGNVILDRLACADILHGNDASRKNNLYAKIIDQGLEVRIATKKHPGRYNADEFLLTIAKNAQIYHKYVGRFFRGMRADAVHLERIGELPKHVVNVFKDVADRFLDAYTIKVPESRPSDPLSRLAEQWDHVSIADFYKKLYLLAGRRAIGTFPPYEVEFFKAMYEYETSRGNPLTPLDRMILENFIQGNQAEPLVSRIRQDTHLSIDHEVLLAQRNSLAYGKPTGEFRKT